MVTILIAMAGTPEADDADFVCDGIDDDVEINAAIKAAGAAGGGSVTIAPGTYNTSRPVTVLFDGVSLRGDSAGGTVIRASNDWTSTQHPDGGLITGVVTFVGVDNFGAHHLIIETSGKLMNGLIAVPTGFNGAGEICTNGIFDANIVRMGQGHTYSIWSFRSQDIQITNNVVEGGATVELAHPNQEGIEIYGGRNVLIAGNKISGIGNAAIQIGGLADQTPDSLVENIEVVGNEISYSRVGVFIGTTAGDEFDPAHARSILIADNVMTDIFEVGLYIRNWTGDAANPPELSDIAFTRNQIEMSYAEGSSINPRGILLYDATGEGETLQQNILIEGNTISVQVTDQVPDHLWLTANSAALVSLNFFANVSFKNNILDATFAGANSKGVLVYDSTGIEISGNQINGTGSYAIEMARTSNFVLTENQIDKRNFDPAAILIDTASRFSVDRNEISLEGGPAINPLIIIASSDDPLSAKDNWRISPSDSSLLYSPIENLRLTGDAMLGEGNAFSNTIIGNERDNLLRGLQGDDRLEGGAGNDFLDGGLGADLLIGGEGDDTYVVDNPGDRVVEAAGGGQDLVRTSVSYALAAGSEVEALIASDWNATGALNLTGNEFNNRLVGNAGTNVLAGGEGDDVLWGQAGDDQLYGGAGDDRLEGGAGNDFLDGGLGADLLIGGEGDDMFVFSKVTDSAPERPGRIMDFSLGDRIDLSGIDAIAGGDDDRFTFIGDDVFSRTAGELRSYQNKDSWFVEGDVNGDGIADFVIEVVRPAYPPSHVDDFLL